MENKKEGQMKNEVESGVCGMVSATFHKQGVPKHAAIDDNPKEETPFFGNKLDTVFTHSPIFLGNLQPQTL